MACLAVLSPRLSANAQDWQFCSWRTADWGRANRTLARAMTRLGMVCHRDLKPTWNNQQNQILVLYRAAIGIGASQRLLAGPLPHHPACGAAPGGSRC